jgi:hypothetical protein
VSIERGKRGMGEDVHCVIVWAVPHRVPTPLHTRSPADGVNEAPVRPII